METIKEFSRRVGCSENVAMFWAKQGRIPGAKRIKYGKQRRWRLEEGSWPDLSTFTTKIPKYLRERHPDLEGWISTSDYARKHGLNKSYASHIATGRTRATPPPAKNKDGIILIPDNWTHEKMDSRKTIRDKKKDLAERGYVPLNEIPEAVGNRGAELRRMCESGEIEGAVFYTRWFVPKSYIDEQMK